jgi:hypothetical protein
VGEVAKPFADVQTAVPAPDRRPRRRIEQRQALACVQHTAGVGGQPAGGEPAFQRRLDQRVIPGGLGEPRALLEGFGCRPVGRGQRRKAAGRGNGGGLRDRPAQGQPGDVGGVHLERIQHGRQIGGGGRHRERQRAPAAAPDVVGEHAAPSGRPVFGGGDLHALIFSAASGENPGRNTVDRPPARSSER